MEQRAQIANVRAEMLLNHLYPELAHSWRVKNKGVFYRNYSEDILSYDPDNSLVELSRDSILQLLPPRLLSGANFKGDVKEQSQKAFEELRLLRELFLPIDSMLFRLNMMAENSISQIITGYESYILKEYYGYDMERIDNKYLRMLLPLLIYGVKLKVDYHNIAILMSRIIGHEVSHTMDCFSQSDREDVMLIRVIFTIDIKELDVSEYRALNEELQPLFEAIREWLIPFDHVSEFRVRDNHSSRTQLDKVDILSYNTRV